MHEAIAWEVYLKGVRAVLGWDIDGVLCEIPGYEKKIDRAVPAFIPGLQAFIQAPGWLPPFPLTRHSVGNKFLSGRTLNPEAIDALLASHEQKLALAEGGVLVKNAIFTERPASARHLIFDLLKEGTDDEALFERVIEGYFDNPYGGDHKRVKPDAAEAIEDAGVGLYLLEDKISSAREVLEAAPSTKIYLLTTRRDSRTLSNRDNLTKVYSPREFVRFAYLDIQNKSSIK